MLNQLIYCLIMLYVCNVQKPITGFLLLLEWNSSFSLQSPKLWMFRPVSQKSANIILPFVTNSILGTYWPGEFTFQCPIFLPFHTVHGVLKARILKWFAIPFSTGPHSVRPPWSVCLGWPHMAWHNFIDLDKAMVSVIRLSSCLWF